MIKIDEEDYQQQNQMYSVRDMSSNQSSIRLPQKYKKYSPPKKNKRCKLLVFGCIILSTLLVLTFAGLLQKEHSKINEDKKKGEDLVKTGDKKVVQPQTSNQQPKQKPKPVDPFQIYNKNKNIAEFKCNQQYLRAWKPQYAKVHQANEKFTIQNVVYPDLFLIQRQGSTSPNKNYEEIITYFDKYHPKAFIYIHSCPIYPLLVIAASTAASKIPIIIGNDFEDQQLVKVNFEKNKMDERLLFEGKDKKKDSIQNADLIVTTQANFYKENIYQRTLFIVEKEVQSPSRELAMKIDAVNNCQPPKITWYWKQKLETGVYQFKQQCD